MKTVLFAPGFQEDIQSRDYQSLINAIERKGYVVRFISINWKRTVIDDWVNQLELEYNKHDASNTILAGFSYGSLSAFMAATKRNPSELWLCSLSPYFADDMPLLKQAWLNGIGKRRTAAFAKLDFETLAKQVHCRTLLFIGELEAQRYPLIARRANMANTLIEDARLYSVSDAGHDVGDDNYIASIESAINKLPA